MRSFPLCLIWMVFTVLAVVLAIFQPPSPAVIMLGLGRALWRASVPRRSYRFQGRPNVADDGPQTVIANIAIARLLA